MRRNYLISLLLFVVVTISHGQNIVPFNQESIAYMGRIETVENQCVKIYWPGTSATINFEGTDAKAILKNGIGTTYFYSIIDGDAEHAKKIKPDTLKTRYLLASGLPKGRHSIQLFKLTDNTTVTSFYGFELNDGARVLKPDHPGKKKIEFYGNSITAGHGVDVPDGQNDSGAPEFFNNYLTYAGRTARHYNAQYSCISRSGIGVMVSWFPIVMPEMYDRLNPSDPDSKWNFSKFTPDLVVINLFQNDSWLISLPAHEQFKARFGTTRPDENKIIKSYQDLVLKIRGMYPKASIICVLGSMDATQKGSPWPGYIDKAVKGMADPKIFTH
ncbi:MAG: electron transporter RnfD [Bacteroidia bacterium]|nr:electron transporter RnfD [Bacteroidia bacterium]